MAQRTLFTDGRLGEKQVDIFCDENGRIAAITPAHDRHNTTHDVEVSLAGQLILPSFVEPHSHLDKAFLADRVDNPDGDLMGAIRGLEAVRHTITFDDTVDRATRAAQLMSRNGVTSVRTHADTTVAGGLTSVSALLEARNRCKDFIDIQVAMLLEWPVTGPDAQSRLSLAREAIASGVHVVGGCPHLDPNPREAVDVLLSLALESGLPLDLHADENLRPDSSDLEHLADIMIERGISHHVTASHCVSLSTRSTDDIRRIADKVAAAGITVVALPQTNLFLQARDIHSLAPRGITPSTLLRQAGVVVAAGADNLQDPFNLVGRADPLEIANLMMVAAHETAEQAFKMVTSHSHVAVHGTTSSLHVGDTANFIGIRATNLREAIAMGPPDRTVVYGGVVLTEPKRNIK